LRPILTMGRFGGDAASKFVYDLQFATVGFVVGALVGMTGVGGGSLMTPFLILLFGIAPATAVGTDLLFAAITKTAGSFVHGFNRTIDWRIVRRLATGSVPVALLTLLILSHLDMAAGGARRLILLTLILALFLTAGVLLTRPRLSALYSRWVGDLNDRPAAIATACVGAVLGVVVTICSVGAGAIGVTALVLLYPRLTTVRIVGSDIAHAVPLTLIAGLGHGIMGSIDLHVLLALLVGSLPGIFAGSLISAWVSDASLRYLLAAALILVGIKLSADLHTQSSPNIESTVSATTR
jgi:uncharacterized membrane protein YfcA